MGTVTAVCVSETKGVRKKNMAEGMLRAGHGLEDDAHAGPGIRQVSLLSLEKIEEFRKRGAIVSFGDFGENLVVSGLDFIALPIGTQLGVGDALLEISQHGKECHTRCAIYQAMGECIMPTQGVFAKVLRDGAIRVGDVMTVCAQPCQP
jgi:MOSC domain-containing protein YiiM